MPRSLYPSVILEKEDNHSIFVYLDKNDMNNHLFQISLPGRNISDIMDARSLDYYLLVLVKDKGYKCVPTHYCRTEYDNPRYYIRAYMTQDQE